MRPTTRFLLLLVLASVQPLAAADGRAPFDAGVISAWASATSDRQR